MAKSRHPIVIQGPHIVIVDAKFRTHIVPEKNRKSTEGYNSRLKPEERSKIFDYDPAHPDMSHYIALAKKGAGKDPETKENEFAMKKVIDHNEKLQKTADQQAEELKNQAADMAELKKQLAELQKANAKKEPVPVKP